MTLVTSFHVESPIGLLAVDTCDGGVSGLYFVSERGDNGRLTPATAVEESVAGQLHRYFEDPQWQFSVPLNIKCMTAFRALVWERLKKTSAGEVLTYRELAGYLNSYPRPIGGACRANPVPIIIPCHRVVPSDTNRWPGHYCGSEESQARATKRWLLEHEAGMPLED